MKNFKIIAFLFITSIVFAETPKPTLENISNNVKELESVYKNTKATSSVVYEDSKTATSTVYKDSKELLSQLYQDGKIVSSKLEAALISIAEGLKTTSLKAWDILVKQQVVWSWCYLILTLSSIFLWYKFGKQFLKTQTDLTFTNELKEK
jgi:hypothetical protein